MADTNDYLAGTRPPGLAVDGSFDTGLGVRAFSVIGDNGEILSVDKETGLLAEDREAN